jgi:hypothetical protein
MLISLLILYGGNVFLEKRDNFIESMTKFTMDYKNSTTEKLYEKLYANAKTYKFEVITFRGGKAGYRLGLILATRAKTRGIKAFG